MMWVLFGTGPWLLRIASGRRAPIRDLLRSLLRSSVAISTLSTLALLTLMTYVGCGSGSRPFTSRWSLVPLDLACTYPAHGDEPADRIGPSWAFTILLIVTVASWTGLIWFRRRTFRSGAGGVGAPTA